jgi:GTPase KRas protein
VYSVSSKSSFTRIKRLQDDIRRVEESTPSDPQLPSLPSAPAQIMIVANKTDQAREVSTEEGRALAEELGCEFAETCAEDYTSIEEACSKLIRQMWGKQDGPAAGSNTTYSRRAVVCCWNKLIEKLWPCS